MTGTFEGVGSLQFTPDNKHCYAYSGTFESVNAQQTMLSFTTGSFYTVGTFTFNGPIRIAYATSGGPAVYQISFNNQVIALGKADTVTSNIPANQYQIQMVVIPPHTEVTFIALCEEDTATELITATFTGKVSGAIVMGIVISSSHELESGAGFYGFSGAVACSTNTKVVIYIQNTGYRDTLLEVTVSGSTTTADLTTGSISNFQTKLNDQVIFNTRIMSVDPTVLNPDTRIFTFFAPRNSEVQIIQLDSDTTGSCTTMLRGYYMEPPVAQQG